MRPLFHPSIEEVTVEGILHALSDPVRVAMYADIVAQERPQSCSNFLMVSDKAIPKSTLSRPGNLNAVASVDLRGFVAVVLSAPVET
jgi:hypothetical protein